MTRRGFIAGGAALVAAGPALAVPGIPPARRLGFEVVRKGSVIGTHNVEFSDSGGLVEARTEVRLAVKFGPITVFRYRHSVLERYRDGRFESLESNTDNDGDPLRVSARRDGDRIVVSSATLGRQTFAADALPLTHWNRACMSAPLFNPQDGKPMPFTVTPRGTEKVALANGQTVPATRYALTGEATLDDYYDAMEVWTALRALAKDGSLLVYQRTV